MILILKNRCFFVVVCLTDCEEYDDDDDDDGEVHDVNAASPESLHHMPDVITSECEQHGKSYTSLLFPSVIFVFCFVFALKINITSASLHLNPIWIS